MCYRWSHRLSRSPHAGSKSSCKWRFCSGPTPSPAELLPTLVSRTSLSLCYGLQLHFCLILIPRLAVPKLTLTDRKLRRCLFSPHIRRSLSRCLSENTRGCLQATHLTVWYKYHLAQRQQNQDADRISPWAPLSAPSRSLRRCGCDTQVYSPSFLSSLAAVSRFALQSCFQQCPNEKGKERKDSTHPPKFRWRLSLLLIIMKVIIALKLIVSTLSSLHYPCSFLSFD